MMTNSYRLYSTTYAHIKFNDCPIGFNGTHIILGCEQNPIDGSSVAGEFKVKQPAGADWQIDEIDVTVWAGHNKWGSFTLDGFKIVPTFEPLRDWLRANYANQIEDALERAEEDSRVREYEPDVDTNYIAAE